MIVEAPKSLNWQDVANILAVIFDFKYSDEGQLPYLLDASIFSGVHLSKGRIHTIVTVRSDGIVCVNIHEDLGKGPHHKVLKHSGKLNELAKDLEKALKRLEEFKRGTSKSIKRFPRRDYLIPPGCPFYKLCFSFNEDSYLCTYELADRKYCREYNRLKEEFKSKFSTS